MNLTEAFESFKKSAKRLEILQEFSIEGGEKEQYENYCNGEKVCEFAELKEWNNLIKMQTEKGKKIERIRVVKNPVSKYIKFEIELGYISSQKCGQEVDFISFEKFNKINKTNINNEFWIFDDEIIFEMIYNEKGEFLKSNQVFGKEYIELYNDLKRQSVPLETVVKELSQSDNLLI